MVVSLVSAHGSPQETKRKPSKRHKSLGIPTKGALPPPTTGGARHWRSFTLASSKSFWENNNPLDSSKSHLGNEVPDMAYTPFAIRSEAIAIRLEAIAIRGRPYKHVFHTQATQVYKLCPGNSLF